MKRSSPRVYYDAKAEAWVFAETKNGKRKRKSFKVRKYGYDAAKELAESMKAYEETSSTTPNDGKQRS